MAGHTRLEIMKRCRREGSNSINNHYAGSYFSIILFPVFTSIPIKDVGDSVGELVYQNRKRACCFQQTLVI